MKFQSLQNHFFSLLLSLLLLLLMVGKIEDVEFDWSTLSTLLDIRNMVISEWRNMEIDHKRDSCVLYAWKQFIIFFYDLKLLTSNVRLIINFRFQLSLVFLCCLFSSNCWTIERNFPGKLSWNVNQVSQVLC